MKNRIITMAFMAASVLTISSCGVLAGAGGTDTGVSVHSSGYSVNDYDLIPVGDRISYTIDISTPEGKLKLHKISLKNAKELAETEASHEYNCDRLIDPRYDYLKKGKRILRITVYGRPGIYKVQDK